MNDNATAQTVSPSEIIERVYAAHGACTIMCDCGDLEIVIDGDSINSEADTVERRVEALIDHARYDHISPRAIIATVHTTIIDFHPSATETPKLELHISEADAPVTSITSITTEILHASETGTARVSVAWTESTETEDVRCSRIYPYDYAASNPVAEVLERTFPGLKLTELTTAQRYDGVRSYTIWEVVSETADHANDAIPTDVDEARAACCDGTGYTGNDRERCVVHYEPLDAIWFGR